MRPKVLVIPISRTLMALAIDISPRADGAVWLLAVIRDTGTGGPAVVAAVISQNRPQLAAFRLTPKLASDLGDVMIRLAEDVESYLGIECLEPHRRTLFQQAETCLDAARERLAVG